MDFKSAFIVMCSNDKDAYEKLTKYSDPTAHYIKNSDLPLRLFCYREGILNDYYKNKNSIFSIKPKFGGGKYIYDDLKEKAWLFYDIEKKIDKIIEHPKFTEDFEEKYFNYLENNYPKEMHFIKVAIILSAEHALSNTYVTKKMVAKDAIDKVAIVFEHHKKFLKDLFFTVCNELFDDYRSTTISNKVTFQMMETYLQTCNIGKIKSIPSYIDYWDRIK